MGPVLSEDTSLEERISRLSKLKLPSLTTFGNTVHFILRKSYESMWTYVLKDVAELKKRQLDELS